ncbi:hypothetical protein [Streptomyces lavendulocolor]|uniref:hypothetical protein n=1 Tax=Streptomyces lavendulocolor TaxID=67316 RepID=UPI003C30D885
MRSCQAVLTADGDYEAPQGPAERRRPACRVQLRRDQPKGRHGRLLPLVTGPRARQEQMLYATFRADFRDALGGVAVNIQATDVEEASRETVLARVS